MHLRLITNSGLGDLDAVGDVDKEKDFEDRGRRDRGWRGGSRGYHGQCWCKSIRKSVLSEATDLEGGYGASGRTAPVKSSQEEVERHYAMHIPRRMWCKVCTVAAIQGVPHWSAKESHKVDGIPEIHMGYKEVQNGLRPCIITREREAGVAF